MSKKDIRLPNGFSYVDHAKRVRLGLTLPEYVLADFFEQCLANAVSASFEIAQRTVGISSKDVYDTLFAQLQLKNIVALEGETVKMTPTWGMVTKKDEQFEEVWAILRKKGNKEKARKNFVKAIRISPFEVIKRGAQLHVLRMADITYQTAGHNFLNPEFRMWLDEKEPSTMVEDKKQVNVMPGNFI